MADLTITAANVAQVSGGKPTQGILGAAGTAGQSIYIDSNNLIQLAKADTATHSQASGILLTSGGAGQPALYLQSGVLNIGATVAIGTVYVVSPNNAGGIAPTTDLSSGKYVQVLALGISASNLQIINKGANPPIAHA